MKNTSIMIDSAKIMSKGQITLPKDFREALRIDTGDRVTLIWDGERIILQNAMHYAMQTLQNAMQGAAEESDFKTDEDIVKFITETRYKKNHNAKDIR